MGMSSGLLRRWVAASVGLVLGAALPVDAQRLNFRQYTSLEGIPQRQILALHQDANGYLWLGSYGGLSRYNGATFVTYTTEEGLSSNAVRDLAEDGEGRLVVATLGGGVCWFEGSGFECLREGDGLVGDYVLDLEVGGDGSLWVATDSGITHLDQRVTTHFTVEQGLPSNEVWKVLEDSGRVWAGTTRGLAVLGDDRFAPVDPDQLGDHAVRTLQPTRDGLLVGTEKALFARREGRLEPIVLPTPSGEAFFTDSVADPAGGVWLASRSGVWRFASGSLESLTTRNGLLSDVVHRVLLDREGDVWFGTESGASKLVPGPLSVYTESEGLPHPFVRAIVEDSLGRLYFGTRSGVAVLDDRHLESIARPDDLENRRVYALCALPDGGMLLGTFRGLVHWHDGVQRTYQEGDGLPANFVLSLVADPSGGVWVGTSGGLARWLPGRVEPVAGNAELSQAVPISMTYDPAGHLWLGLRAGGVLVHGGSEMTRLGVAEGLTDQTIWSLASDRSGVMWVGTNGAGAFRIEGDAIRQFTTRDGLANNFVWQVLPDSSGAVWMFTSQGLDRLADSGFTHFGSDDGLIDLEGSANAAYEDSRGELWFGTASGLVHYVTTDERRNTVPPPVFVEEAWDSARGAIKPGSRIPLTDGVLTFRFIALSYREEAAVRYRHRLLPVESRWSAPTAERSIGYARLGPGRYDFEVRGCNDDGVWSREPARFGFEILPAFWQRWWFRLSMLGLVGGFLWLGVRVRMSRLDRERRRLEALVEDRTQELTQKNELLKELAVVDGLTGVSNRRHFEETLRSEFQKLSRGPSSGRLSLLILDLDRFKRVNDTYGHPVGDQLLKAVAEQIRAVVRASDLVARYGGDEFSVVLPMTDLAGSTVVARKIQAAIPEAVVPVGDEVASVTASIGVAESAAPEVFSEHLAHRLAQQADTALYEAKRQGGDRIVVHDEG